MATLLTETCRNHPGREASARCSACRFSYCRECVAEHEGLIFCGACLRKRTRRSPRISRRLRHIPGLLAPLAGWLLFWIAFYTLGRIVLSLVRAVS
ncbi:MAG: hypothetical protein ACE15E_15165 [Acidobacteriota bacterium]